MKKLLKTRHVKKGGGGGRDLALHYHMGWVTVIIVHIVSAYSISVYSIGVRISVVVFMRTAISGGYIMSV
jgi:hypothetical protein